MGKIEKVKNLIEKVNQFKWEDLKKNEIENIQKEIENLAKDLDRVFYKIEETKCDGENYTEVLEEYKSADEKIRVTIQIYNGNEKTSGASVLVEDTDEVKKVNIVKVENGLIKNYEVELHQ